MQREVTEKPGEQNTIPLVPANCNFQAARKMHVENLEHQPLPDSIMDRAFRRYQALGATNPEMALNVIPTATGNGMFFFCFFYSGMNQYGTLKFFDIQFRIIFNSRKTNCKKYP